MAKKYIDADKLIAEIERRKEEYKEDRYMSDYRGQIAYYKDEIYDDLLHFIDSLQQEQSCDTCTNDKGCVTCKDGELWEGKEQPVIKKSNALFDKCVAECDPAVMKEVSDEIDEMLEKEQKPSEDLEEAVKEYRRESYRKSVLPNIDGPMPEYGGSIKDAFIAGAEWQKEEMLKDAEECDLYWDGDFLAIDLNMRVLGYSERDKVKIIIVKED